MKRPRFLLYLYGTPNIVGAMLGILGLLLFFTGIIDRFWFLIVIGLYGIGVLATPRNPAYDLHLRNQLSAEEIREELEQLVRSIRKKVPNEILAKVVSIKDSILEILPGIVDVNSSDYEIFTIRQTALDYLPETLGNYLNLPPAFRNLHPVRDGKTAKQLLSEQLDLLDQQMKEIAEDFYKNDSQKLMAHGRFLESKFKKTDLWFENGG
ncbi:MAG: hypothetical protein JXA89_26485 [Anaerolineae bacterium]|nr:hypothetical protein [Anaerolineae bacterium]